MNYEQYIELIKPVACKTEYISSIAKWSEKSVLGKHGLNLDTYTTAGMMNVKTSNPFLSYAEVIGGSEVQFQIEYLPRSLWYLAEEQGITLRPFNSKNFEHINHILSAALNVVYRSLPNVLESVRILLRILHILEAQDPDHDISFTLPELPHSIFISIPDRNCRINVLRVAEAIIHEVMHLQLSLVEKQCPLILESAPLELTYAPWREEERPISGVIHGLFVFNVIENFYRSYINIAKEEELDYISSRIEEILLHRQKVNGDKEYMSLSYFGAYLFGSLL